MVLKYFLTSLVLTIGIIHTAIANESSLVLNTSLLCTTSKGLEQVLDKHGEEAALTAMGIRDIDGNFVAVSTVLFINPKTKSWTLVEKIKEDLYCVAALGESISPYISEEKNRY